MINPRQVRILIADDEASIRDLLATRFAIFGFQAILAENGIDAWEKLQADPLIKIMVTDLSMPGMNGQELIKKCKESNPESPRIFAITGQPQWSIETLYALGAEGVLYKPFDARNLLNITRNSLLSFSERLRYPPYINSAANIKLQFPSLKVAAPTLSLGRGGFFMTSPEALPAVGQIISFDLDLGGDLQLVGNGIIRWNRSELKTAQFTSGIEFTYLKPKSIEVLQKWLNQNPMRAFIPSPQSFNSIPSTAKLQSTG